MSITHELGGRRSANLARSFREAIQAPTSELAEILIEAKYLSRGNYLERVNLDPGWMTAVFVRAIALRKTLGLHPKPNLDSWMDD